MKNFYSLERREDGQIVKTLESPVGGLQEVVEELTRLSAMISALTANYERAKEAYEIKVPELEAMKEALTLEAKNPKPFKASVPNEAENKLSCCSFV